MSTIVPHPATAVTAGTTYNFQPSASDADGNKLTFSVTSKPAWARLDRATGHFYGTPFGGFKNSGLGREEGIDELLSYTETKTIHIMLGDGAAKD